MWSWGGESLYFGMVVGGAGLGRWYGSTRGWGWWGSGRGGLGEVKKREESADWAWPSVFRLVCFLVCRALGAALNMVEGQLSCRAD